MGADKAAAPRILILGGTTEASALVRALAARRAELEVTLSLAGRTSSPKPEPVATRIGGFGGADGLAAWIAEHRIDLVVDATHPFAAQMSRHAAQACAQTGTHLLALRRPPWKAVDGDCWTEVAEMAEAAAALGAAPRRVFLTIGRQGLAAFGAAPQHRYLIRAIEPVDDGLPLPRMTVIAARGPFSQDAERETMREAGIDILVTKNAGGLATYAKIAAARELGIPVVMVRRPDLPEVPAVPDAARAYEWLTGSVQAYAETKR